jgi:hypothetical protein
VSEPVVQNVPFCRVIVPFTESAVLWRLFCRVIVPCTESAVLWRLFCRVIVLCTECAVLWRLFCRVIVPCTERAVLWRLFCRVIVPCTERVEFVDVYLRLLHKRLCSLSSRAAFLLILFLLLFLLLFLWHYEPRWPLASSKIVFFNPDSNFRNFSNQSLFYVVGLLDPSPIPNLEGQSIPFCLGHHLCPVWQGRPCQ